MLHHAPSRTERSRRARRTSPSALALLTLLVGCDDTFVAATHPEVETLAATLAPSDGDEVTSEGEGCPKGTWRLVAKDGGESFDLHFDAFYGELARNRSDVAKRCDLVFKLKDRGVQYTPVGLTFALAPALGRSTEATFASKVYWTDANPAALSKSKTLTGPWEPEIEVSAANALVWSTCGEPAVLRVDTKLGVRRTSSSSSGSVVITKLANIRFSTQACQKEGDPGEPGPDDNPDPGDKPAPTPGDGLKITGVQTAGRGCPSGNAAVALTADGQSAVATFPSFAVSSSSRLADCTLVLDVEVPEGQQYALASFSAEGEGTLAAGDRVRLATYGAFGGVGGATAEGSAQVPTATSEVTGPHAGTVSLAGTVEHLHYSECGRKRNAQVRMNLLATQISEGSSFALKQFGPFKLVTRRCGG